LAKAPTATADFSFLDLEDSVAPNEKVAARAKVVNAITNLAWDDRVLCVRVNAWDTPWTYGDVIDVVGNAGARLDEVMLPKVQRASDVVALDLLLTQVERNAGLESGHIGIEAQIETAQGLINVEEICASSPRLESIVFESLQLRLRQDLDGRTGQRSARHRRPVPEGPRPGRPALRGRDLRVLRLRRQVGTHP
jgi:citrate lyase subunit beta/citryl-CoA lyase